MKALTQREEIIMLSILNLGRNAYLVGIADHLSGIAGKKASLTSVHLPLSRLEKHGLIAGEFGESSPVRGGRRRKIYSLTRLGLERLEEVKALRDKLWEKAVISPAPPE